MKALKKVLEMDLIIAGFFMFVLIVITFFGVIFRYCFQSPIIWGEEVQLCLIVVVVFFGAAAGFRYGSHIAIDFLVDKFSPKAQKAAEWGILIISALILIYFGIQGGALAKQMLLTERSTDILKIPYFLPYLSFPIGCFLMVINLIIYEYEKN